MSNPYGNVPGFSDHLAPRSGKILNRRYQLEGQLGASVWRAYEQIRSEFFIVRFLPDALCRNPQEFQKFKSGMNRLKTMTHPNLVSPVSIEEDPLYGTYLLAPSVTGRPLDQILPGEIGADRIPELIEKVAASLDFLNTAGLIHQRVKPSNIIVDLQNGKLTGVYLTDSITGRILDDFLTRSRFKNNRSERIFYYTAPEIWNGRSGAFSDQFSLAVIAYELFSGSVPFTGASIQELRNEILHSDPEKIDAVSSRINKALKRALAKDPQERFDSCQDFARELQAPQPEEKARKKKSKVAKIDNQGVIALQGTDSNAISSTGNSVLDQMQVYHAGQVEEEPDHSKWIKLGVTLVCCLMVLGCSWLFFGGSSKSKTEMHRNGSRPNASLKQKIGLEKEDRKALNELDTVTVMKKKDPDAAKSAGNDSMADSSNDSDDSDNADSSNDADDSDGSSKIAESSETEGSATDKKTSPDSSSPESDNSNGKSNQSSSSRQDQN